MGHERFAPGSRKIAPELVAVRRQIHMAGTGFQEERTAQLVCDYVRGLGLPSLPVGGTGVVAVHEGDRRPARLRYGQTWIAFLCKRIPACHMHRSDLVSCMPAGMTRTSPCCWGRPVSATHRELFPGRVVFLFQPLKNCPRRRGCHDRRWRIKRPQGAEAVAALHVSPDLPAGQFGVAAGPIMAAADRFTLTITGQGGHGAAPQNTVDAIAVAAQVVTALQQIVSRQADPQEPLVDHRYHHRRTGFNVITDRVQMTGTTRYLNPAFRAWLPERMAAIAQVAAAFGGGARLDYEPAFSPVINDHRLVELAARVVAGMEGPLSGWTGR